MLIIIIIFVTVNINISIITIVLLSLSNTYWLSRFGLVYLYTKCILSTENNELSQSGAGPK